MAPHRGSSRIISLGCVRAANNSLLFPATGTDNVNDNGRGGSSKRSLVRFAQFASCRVRLPWMRMHADAIVRDFPWIYARSDTSISSPGRLTRSIVFVRDCRKIVESLTRKLQKSTIVLRDAYNDWLSFTSVLDFQTTVTKASRVLWMYFRILHGEKYLIKLNGILVENERSKILRLLVY